LSSAPESKNTGPPSIVLDDVSLRFLVGRKSSSLKSLALGSISGLLGRKGQGSSAQEMWSLKNVDLKIQHGDRLGVIGRNGAGKTTLMRVLAGIYSPTMGRVSKKGSVAPVLQIGLGFNPELTGVENVYLAAAIAGLHRGAVDEKLDSIFEFAGLEDYRELPVKFYSTGMHARLALTVATELETEILLLDEVFAVGDIHWVRKAIERVEALIERVGILVLVSHDLGLISRVCNRAILLEEGEIIASGPVDEVIDRYTELS